MYLGEQHEALLTTAQKPKGKKGDPRVIVKMSDIELAMFGGREDSGTINAAKEVKAKRGFKDPEEWKSIDMEDTSDEIELNTMEDATVDEAETGNTPSEDEIAFQRTRVRPPQSQSAVNGSIGGEKSWVERAAETPEMLQKRRDGQKRAEERELVRNVARRAVVFGLVSEVSSKPSKHQIQQPGEMHRKCEALMSGKVVEPSFAKGDWCIRWRED